MNNDAARNLMTSALSTVLAANGGVLPDHRVDVTIDGVCVRVYPAFMINACVQFTHNDENFSASIRKGNKLGPLKSWKA